MILYDENGSPVSLDLEAVQNAINTLGSLTEDNDMYFEEASADELAAYYEDYLALMDADNAFAVAEASEVVSEAKNNPLHNNRDMKDVIKVNNNQIRDINKRMRKALRRKDFDEADKLCEQGLSISKATYAEIKKMPASVIGNIIPIAIGSIIYYLVYQFLIWLGVDTDLLKLLSALLVAVCLGIPHLKSKYFSKPVKRGGSENA